ncbi:hypothetical protein OIY81_950 [Cryptosporidium canis]|uniref:Uncharacterized protein n=1 Tax=Cryptosporidium canis TaxID=195482 RepID=A0ABQ8P5A4_9CRYT|nr:hypothetical protein OJ252_2382 [Cryptosporidium canis]KAJ1613423.1 hypothetical protein OIY81_950 [Cryptosporidium canis]
MSHIEDSNDDFDDYFEEQVTDRLNESYDEKSDMEYCSPRFGESNFSEENADIETDNEVEAVIYDDDINLYYNMEAAKDDFYNEAAEQTKIDISANENHIQVSENPDLKYINSNILQTPRKVHCEYKENALTTNSNYLQDENIFEPFDLKKKSNADENIVINISNSTVENEISYKELQLEVKSLLEASNKHQEKVHAELDELLIENENFKKEISHLNDLLKGKELLLSQYKLNSMALNAQIPFLKSKSLMEEEKEELYFLRNKIEFLESKLKEHEKELDNANAFKERATFLENELERITKDFNELEIFQTNQLRIADDEIATLSEAKNSLFREIHSLMKENEGLKLTKSVIKRIETHYKNINDEAILPSIEEELSDTIKELMENKEINDNNEISTNVFEICQSIIPRLAYEIAEEMIIRLDSTGKPNEQMKRSLTKKNVSVQVGFPLFNGSADSELNIISTRSELMSLRTENCKLKKENQKLKQDLFLFKRISHRSKDRVKASCSDHTKSKLIEFSDENQQELALNGIKWLTSVVNEIDELEQRCSSIKNCQDKIETRRSSAYNSTVASFEDIHSSINGISVKDEKNIDQELSMLREKLVSEGILIEE